MDLFTKILQDFINLKALFTKSREEDQNKTFQLSHKKFQKEV